MQLTDFNNLIDLNLQFFLENYEIKICFNADLFWIRIILDCYISDCHIKPLMILDTLNVSTANGLRFLNSLPNIIQNFNMDFTWKLKLTQSLILN